MNIAKKIAFVLLCLICWIIPSLVQAAPFDVENGKVYGHKGPDGTTSLFAKAIGGNWNFTIHKVFPNKGQMYYFLSAELEDRKVGKKHVNSATLTINGKSVMLQPLTNFQPVIVKNSYQEYYSLPEDVRQQIAQATEMSIAFQFDGASPETGAVKDSTVKAFKRLIMLEKDSYIREGKVLEATEEPSKAFFHPQIFIPNAKPEEVLDALVYEINFDTYKGKEEFNYASGYFINHTSDPYVTQLVCRSSFGDTTDFVTVACRPYSNGVWVTINLMMQKCTPGRFGYNGAYFPGSVQYSFYENDSSNSLVVNTRNYWRTHSELWAMNLHSVYNQLYGKVDYGFSLARKDIKKGPFKVNTVDSKKFPELDRVSVGDSLVAIDGVSTTLMGVQDLDYWLDNGISGQRTFTFKSITGEEKKVAISPQVQLTAPAASKDYRKILMDKMPKWFVEKGIRALSPKTIFLESNVYDPLGTGIK
ncbi:hypothetical protein [Sporomusa acidovorans]|uniref:PDZ domain-containing protein n=1 Tax=Sporomusa acidovorans (strain ATCC 49682 / DSM 3132 / Mol) TaxID=1123286 RepID=A0ABZ3J5C6_SPOA4|nr:hypothetical protein [Sporomusa acidovorans]OZC24020.1 hypothetical protein SPACI_03230 [Sporomusa acidovorans DSM 3132]SDF57121.1 hypothetical protein SAMN04488499_10595 [Sporomusa acidovorans]